MRARSALRSATRTAVPGRIHSTCVLLLPVYRYRSPAVMPLPVGGTLFSTLARRRAAAPRPVQSDDLTGGGLVQAEGDEHDPVVCRRGTARTDRCGVAP